MLENEQNNIFARIRNNVYQNGDNLSKSRHDFDKVNPKVLPFVCFGLTTYNIFMMVMMILIKAGYN